MDTRGIAVKRQVHVALFEKDPITRFINEKLFSAYKDRIRLVQFDNLTSGLVEIVQNIFDFVIVDLHIDNDIEAILDIPKKLLLEYDKKEFTLIAHAVVLNNNDLNELLNAGYDYCWMKPISFENVDFLLDVSK